MLEITDPGLFTSTNPLSSTKVEVALSNKVSEEYAEQVTIASAADTAATTAVTAIASQQIVVSLAAGISLKFLWGILNFLQVFEFLFLIKARFPLNFLEIAEVAEVANFEFKFLEELPNFISVLVNPDDINQDSLNDNF